MFKRNCCKLFSVLLIALMFFTIPANATALADSIEKYNPGASSELNQATDKKPAVPDRKAIVEILNKDTGEVIENTLYLTPGTPIKEDSFKELNSAYELKKITINELSQAETEEIGVRYVETIFDVGNFMISLYEYNQNPSFWTGFWMVTDGASVVLPGIPSISGVKRMMESSSKLHNSLRYGVKTYNSLSVPSGYERHHIFEKRFAGRLGTTSGRMLCIGLTTSDHQLITNKMRQKIPYGTDPYSLSIDEIMNAHTDSYRELWNQTGDSLWEFQYRFAQTGQHTTN